MRILLHLCVLLCLGTVLAAHSAARLDRRRMATLADLPNQTALDTYPMTVAAYLDITRVRSIDEKTQSFLIQTYIRLVWNTSDCVPNPILCDPLSYGVPFVTFDNANDVSVESITPFCPGLPAHQSCYDMSIALTVFKEYQLQDFFYDNQALQTFIELWYPLELMNLEIAHEPVGILDQERELDATSGVPNGWDFVNISTSTFTRAYASVTYTGAFQAMRNTVVVQRNPTTWSSKILLPLGIIMTFSFSTFLLGIELATLGARLSSLFSAMLMFVVFNLYLYGLVPSADHPTFTDGLISDGMKFILVAMIETIITALLTRFLERAFHKLFRDIERAQLRTGLELKAVAASDCDRKVLTADYPKLTESMLADRLEDLSEYNLPSDFLARRRRYLMTERILRYVNALFSVCLSVVYVVMFQIGLNDVVSRSIDAHPDVSSSGHN